MLSILGNTNLYHICVTYVQPTSAREAGRKVTYDRKESRIIRSDPRKAGSRRPKGWSWPRQKVGLLGEGRPTQQSWKAQAKAAPLPPPPHTYTHTPPPPPLSLSTSLSHPSRDELRVADVPQPNKEKWGGGACHRVTLTVP